VPVNVPEPGMVRAHERLDLYQLSRDLLVFGHVYGHGHAYGLRI
jgi:hypothetical protein